MTKHNLLNFRYHTGFWLIAVGLIIGSAVKTYLNGVNLEMLAICFVMVCFLAPFSYFVGKSMDRHIDHNIATFREEAGIGE